MVENKHTADSPPLQIEESRGRFPDLSQKSLEEHEQRHRPLHEDEQDQSQPSRSKTDSKSVCSGDLIRVCRGMIRSP